MKESAMAQTAKKEQPKFEDTEPAKGGTEGAKREPYPSGDSPKPHGDPFKDDLTPKK
jgi:hypothetical protein